MSEKRVREKTVYDENQSTRKNGVRQKPEYERTEYERTEPSIAEGERKRGLREEGQEKNEGNKRPEKHEGKRDLISLEIRWCIMRISWATSKVHEEYSRHVSRSLIFRDFLLDSRFLVLERHNLTHFDTGLSVPKNQARRLVLARELIHQNNWQIHPLFWQSQTP